MYKDVLQDISNVAIWPIISLIIFFTFFIGVVWWVVKADKKFISEMSHKPLENKDDT